MHTIDAVKKIAIATYNDVDADGKAIIARIFGAKMFLSIFERIKSFEDGCADLGKDPVAEMAQFDHLHESIRKKHRALHRCDIITEALNEGVEFDYDDDTQQKWWNWYYLDQPGFRFGGSGYSRTDSGATGGSRPFASRAIAEYFVKQFLHEIKDVFIP